MENLRPHVLMNRAASYLRFLRAEEASGVIDVDYRGLAKYTGFSEEQVREDINAIFGGQSDPTVAELERACEVCIGKRGKTAAILIGVGNLGSAILSYKGFDFYGIDIVAAYDKGASLIGTEISGCKVQSLESLEAMAPALSPEIGIITVPDSGAQDACDALVRAGVKAIWNFSAMELSVPSTITVRNENIAEFFAGSTRNRTLLLMMERTLRIEAGEKELELADAIHKYLTGDKVKNAVLVGVGNLGSAVLSYKGINAFGVKIVAAYDRSPNVIGKTIGGVTIDSFENALNLKETVDIGIIAVPDNRAQFVCDRLVQMGVKSIWNFAPAALNVPDDVTIKNENLADSLLMLVSALR